MTQLNGKNVAIYVRASGASEANKEEAINNQLNSLRSFVEAGGGIVWKEYVDVGASNDDHPAYQQLTADACKGHFDTVAVYNLSRLFRDKRVLQKAISDLEKGGVEVISMTTSTSRLIYGLFGDPHCRT